MRILGLHGVLAADIVSLIMVVLVLSLTRRVSAFRSCPHGGWRTVPRRAYSKSNLQMEASSVSIIGGGLAGLATAYHLAESGACSRIVIIDSHSPGDGGASAVAAGLVHPFTPCGKIIYRGLEGLEETLKMVKFAQKHTSVPLLDESADKIMRPCYTEKAYNDWRKAAEEHPDWLQEISVDNYYQSVCNDKSGEASQVPNGVFLMQNALLIDTPSYLRALWAAMKNEYINIDLSWEMEAVKDIETQLGLYDAVIVASGVGVSTLWPLRAGEELPFKFVRGQNLYYKRADIEIGKAAVLCGEYVCPIGDDLVCGATHEYGELLDIENKPPNMEQAKALLDEKITRLVPKMDQSNPYKSKAGIRVASQRTHLGKLPVIAEHPLHPGRLWLLTGFGSRGLIHHALLGRTLANAIVLKEAIPEELCSNLSSN